MAERKSKTRVNDKEAQQIDPLRLFFVYLVTAA
jgi:hypothetical protein